MIQINIEMKEMCGKVYGASMLFKHTILPESPHVHQPASS